MFPANKMLIGFCKYLFFLFGEVASIILFLSSWLLQHLANFRENSPKSWPVISGFEIAGRPVLSKTFRAVRVDFEYK